MIPFETLIGSDVLRIIFEVIFLLAIIFNYKTLLYEKDDHKNGYLLLWVLLTLVAIFYAPDKGTDTLTSSITFESGANMLDSDNSHFEYVYRWIYSIANNYLLWRLIVWGAAAFIFVKLQKKLGINSGVAMFMWASLGIDAFFYQRISLGIAIMFVAICLLLNRRGDGQTVRLNRWIILPIALLIGSLFFHRSMPLYILISLVAIFMPSKKWTFLFFIVILSIALPLLLTYSNIYLFGSAEAVEEMAETYLNVTYRDYGIKGTLFNIFKSAPFAIMLVYCVYDYFKAPTSYTIYEKYFLLLSFFLYLLSFLLIGDVAASAAGKMKTQSLFSMTMFLSLYYNSHKGTKQCNIYAKAVLFTSIVIFVYSNLLH